MTDMPPLRGLSPHAWGCPPARNLIEGDLWVRAAATSTVSHGMGGAGGEAPQHGCAEHTGPPCRCCALTARPASGAGR